MLTSMSEVVVLLRSDTYDVFRLLEAWWQGLLLLGRLVLWYCRLLQEAAYELKVPEEAMMAPSVFQRTKSPRTSPGNLPRKLQNGTEASGQSDPTADSSPGNSISMLENFELLRRRRPRHSS